MTSGALMTCYAPEMGWVTEVDEMTNPVTWQLASSSVLSFLVEGIQQNHQLPTGHPLSTVPATPPLEFCGTFHFRHVAAKAHRTFMGILATKPRTKYGKGRMGIPHREMPTTREEMGWVTVIDKAAASATL